MKDNSELASTQNCRDKLCYRYASQVCGTRNLFCLGAWCRTPKHVQRQLQRVTIQFHTVPGSFPARLHIDILQNPPRTSPPAAKLSKCGVDSYLYRASTLDLLIQLRMRVCDCNFRRNRTLITRTCTSSTSNQDQILVRALPVGVWVAVVWSSMQNGVQPPALNFTVSGFERATPGSIRKTFLGRPGIDFEALMEPARLSFCLGWKLALLGGGIRGGSTLGCSELRLA